MAGEREELEALRELAELERLDALERRITNSPVDQSVKKLPPVFTAGIQATPERMGPVSDNPGQTLREGIGSGMVRMGRGGTNVLVKAMNAMRGLPPNTEMPEFAADESLREQDKLDAPLGETSEGSLGQFAGAAAASLPMGVIPRAPAAALEGAGALARTLGGPTVRSALEGSISGAAAADPDEQLEAAAAGGAGGALMTKVGQGLKRMAGGIAQPGEAAGHLEQFAEQHGKDIFIPAAQAIPDSADLPSRLVKTLYKEVLPLVPGASSQIKSQGKRLGDKVREIAFDEADFKGVLTADDVKDPQLAVTKLRKVVDNEIADTVKAYAFRVPSRDQIVMRIESAMPDVDDVTKNKVATLFDESLVRFSSNKQSLVGENLLNSRAQMLQRMKKLSGPELEAAESAIGIYDDIIESRLKLGGKTGTMARDLARWQATKESMKDLDAVEQAVKKAEVTRGEFTPSQLVKSAGTSDTQRLLGQTAHEVLNENLGSPSAAGRMAAYGALGTLGYFGSPVALGGVVGGGNALATELAQDMLLGRTSTQQALIEALRRNSGKVRTLGTALRGGATAEIGDE